MGEGEAAATHKCDLEIGRINRGDRLLTAGKGRNSND